MKKTLIALMAMAGVAMGDTYWSFEGTFASAGDATYNGKLNSTVTLVNTTTTTGDVLGDSSATNLGLAGNFVDGSYVSVSGASSLTSTLTTGSSKKGDFTIMTYANFNEIVTNGGEKGYFIFGSDKDNDAGIAVGVLADQDSLCNDTSKIDFLVKGKKHYVWDTTVTVGEWTHLAFSYASESNTVTLYVNGESKGALTLEDPFATPNDDGMYIGAGSTNGGQDDFVGQIAHFQIITGTALDADGVKQYASTIIPEPATATLSLLALAGLAARRRRK
mgnify:CR=1 FL=1